MVQVWDLLRVESYRSDRTNILLRQIVCSSTFGTKGRKGQYSTGEPWVCLGQLGNVQTNIMCSNHGDQVNRGERVRFLREKRMWWLRDKEYMLRWAILCSHALLYPARILDPGSWNLDRALWLDCTTLLCSEISFCLSVEIHSVPRLAVAPTECWICLALEALDVLKRRDLGP